MKKNTIISLIIFIAIIFIAFGGVLLSINKPKENSSPNQEGKYTPNASLLENIENETFKITKIDIKKIDDYYEFKFQISNITDKITEIQLINFVFYDKKGKEVGRIENEMQPVSPEQPTTHIIYSNDDKLFNAHKIKIELKPLIVE